MSRYVEMAPPPRLSKHVECFWFLTPAANETRHRVLPDGCTDVVFSLARGQVRGFIAGAMTHALITPVGSDETMFGVRFHPGTSQGLLRAPLPMLTNRVIDLESMWGREGAALEQRLASANSGNERMRLIAQTLRPADGETPVEQAARWVVAHRGNTSAEELARHAGLSARQFRRLCIEQTGVGPKMLCRTVRFRHAVNHITARKVDWAGFALDHGYYDQAHFINEFHEFSGLTPMEYAGLF